MWRTQSTVLPCAKMNDQNADKDINGEGKTNRKFKSGPVLALVAIAIISIIAVVIWMINKRPTTLADILARNGYMEMIPPSHFSGPGTLNTLEVRSDGRVQLHPTCELDESMLTAVIQESPTVDQDLSQNIYRQFDLSEKIKEMLTHGAKAHDDSTVSLSLKNVRILLMSDQSLFEVQRDTIKEQCEEVILWNLTNGGKVCQTKAVLKADLTYKIDYDGGMSVSDQSSLTNDIAAKLNLKADESQSNQIVGRDLYVGVKLAPYGILTNSPDAEPVDCDVFKTKK